MAVGISNCVPILINLFVLTVLQDYSGQICTFANEILVRETETSNISIYLCTSVTLASVFWFAFHVKTSAQVTIKLCYMSIHA